MNMFIFWIGMARRRTPTDPRKKGERTRAHLVKTAFSLFETKGFERTTLRDIATAAGLDWEAIGASLRRDGRLHLETY